MTNRRINAHFQSSCRLILANPPHSKVQSALFLNGMKELAKTMRGMILAIACSEVVMLASLGEAQAQWGYQGRANLFLTGDPDWPSVPGTKSVFDSIPWNSVPLFSLNEELELSNTVVRMFSEPGGTIQQYGKAKFRSGNHEMGIDLETSVSFVGDDGPFSQPLPVNGSVVLSYNDLMTLIWVGDEKDIPNIAHLGLKYHWTVEGSGNAHGIGSDSPYTDANTYSEAIGLFYLTECLLLECNEDLQESFRVGYYNGSTSFSDGSREEVPPMTVSGQFFLTPLIVTARIELFASTSIGSVDHQFFNTMKFDSVTFTDGTTPESHGFEISFASGLPSPNLLPVPEPTTCTLALTALCLAMCRRRTF